MERDGQYDSSSIFKYLVQLSPQRKTVCSVQGALISDPENMINVTSLKLFYVPDVKGLVYIVCILSFHYLSEILKHLPLYQPYRLKDPVID